MAKIHVHVHVLSPGGHSSGGRALTAKVRGPWFNPGWLPVFTVLLKIYIPKPFFMYTVHCTSCALGDRLVSRLEGYLQPRELWFSIYSCTCTCTCTCTTCTCTSTCTCIIHVHVQVHVHVLYMYMYLHMYMSVHAVYMYMYTQCTVYRLMKFSVLPLSVLCMYTCRRNYKGSSCQFSKPWLYQTILA